MPHYPHNEYSGFNPLYSLWLQPKKHQSHLRSLIGYAISLRRRTAKPTSPRPASIMP